MHPAARERALDRGADRRVGVAEEPRRVLAEEIDIRVAVEIPDPRAFAPRDDDRERRVEITLRVFPPGR